ncbi:prepilin-type N-terminal cleavage/methylation domain-containing protein [Thomasclavelia sp.]
MRSNQGFTLIEVIFTISIIIILSLFTLDFAISSPPQLSIDQQCNKVINLLEEAKTKALINHEQVDILIDVDQISYNYQKEFVVKLNKNYYFQDSFELYFNKNGNVNSGNHLNICNQKECRSIIFNVGSGTFYVKE